MEGQSDCREVLRSSHGDSAALGCATDVLVVRQSDVEQYGDNPYLVLHTAISEGKELYRAIC
jgi:hypothetical protein